MSVVDLSGTTSAEDRLLRLVYLKEDSRETTWSYNRRVGLLGYGRPGPVANWRTALSTNGVGKERMYIVPATRLTH